MSLLEAAIGLLSPPECVGCGLEGSALCDHCQSSNILPFGLRCWRCNSLSNQSRTCPSCRKVGSPSHVWITTTYEGLARDLVRKYKFGHLRAGALPLAEMMGQTCLGANLNINNHLVVAVPTATSRVRTRGFDHSLLLAKQISRRLGLKSAAALGRLGQDSQIGTGRDQRLKQSAGQYFVRSPWQVRGQSILLIDDVITTGGTMLSAAYELRQAGAIRVDALIFAKRL